MRVMQSYPSEVATVVYVPWPSCSRAQALLGEAFARTILHPTEEIHSSRPLAGFRVSGLSASVAV